MPLDPNIILQAGRGVTPMYVPTPTERLNQQIQQLNLQRMQQAQTDDQAMRQAFQQNYSQPRQSTVAPLTVDPNTFQPVAGTPPMTKASFNQEGFANSLASAGLYDQWTKAKADAAAAQDAELKKKRATVDRLHSLLATSIDQPSYTQNLNQARAEGMDVADVSPTYNPQAVQSMLFQVAGAKATLDYQEKMAKAKEEASSAGKKGALYDYAASIGALNPDGTVNVSNPNVSDYNRKLTKSAGESGNTGPATPRPMASTDGVDPNVTALLEARVPYPTGKMAADPYWRSIISQAAAIDPTFNAATYQQRAATQKAFTTGSQSNSINALNTAMGHAAELSDLVDQLHNSQYSGVNAVSNWVGKHTGNTAITAFDTVKKALADEATKVWRGTGGSERDVQEAMANLDSSLSPQQLQRNILEFTRLMASKQAALEAQYRKGMGRVGTPLEVLSAEASDALDKIRSRNPGVPGNVQPTKPVPPQNTAPNKFGFKVGQTAKKSDGTIMPDGTYPDFGFTVKDGKVSSIGGQ